MVESVQNHPKNKQKMTKTMGAVLSLDFLGLYKRIIDIFPIENGDFPMSCSFFRGNLFSISLQTVFLPKARDFHGLHGLFRFTRLAVQQLLGILLAPRQRGKPSRVEPTKKHTQKLKEGCFLAGFLA